MGKKKNSTLRYVFKDPKTVILLIVTIALAVVAIFLYATRPSQIDRLSQSYIDTLDNDVIQQNVNTSYDNEYQIDTYSIYGESLKLYHSKANSSDATNGMTVLLKNVETGEELSYTFGSGGEDGIKLGQLPEGLYEVFVYDHYTKKRVYMDHSVHSKSFQTMRRHKKVKTIKLEADKDLFSDAGVNLSENYCFISVMDTIPIVEKIDVMIDPGGNVYDPESDTNDSGDKGNGLSQEDNYELALKIKKKLEKKGLRVKISRKKNEYSSYYGKKSRIGRGYEQEAKVYLSLGLMSDDEIDRPILVVSPYTSGNLANTIAYECEQNNVELYGSDDSDTGLNVGVYYDDLIQNDAGKDTKYEYYPQLRESGAKVTYAGTMDNADLNRRYRNAFGMYGVYVQYANVDDEGSVNYYKNHKAKLAKSIADGIIDYFEIEGEFSESTTESH